MDSLEKDEWMNMVVYEGYVGNIVVVDSDSVLPNAIETLARRQSSPERPRVLQNSFYNGAMLPPLLTQHSLLIHALRSSKHINGPVGHWWRSANICYDAFPLGYGAQSCP